jgi:hypothetical protein
MNSTISKISAALAPILGQNARMIEAIVRQGLTYAGGVIAASGGAHALSVHGVDVSGAIQGTIGFLMTALGVWLTAQANTAAAIQVSANQNLVVAQAVVASPTTTAAATTAAQALIDNHVTTAAAVVSSGLTRVPFPISKPGNS